ncbi:hypothetical protein WG66_014477 [Moniliophthora roreri]|nr:hypothetical protein WG66_014477 [Moniliophthora roreri]
MSEGKKRWKEYSFGVMLHEVHGPPQTGAATLRLTILCPILPVTYSPHVSVSTLARQKIGDGITLAKTKGNMNLRVCWCFSRPLNRERQTFKKLSRNGGASTRRSEWGHKTHQGGLSNTPGINGLKTYETTPRMCPLIDFNGYSNKNE